MFSERIPRIYLLLDKYYMRSLWLKIPAAKECAEIVTLSKKLEESVSYIPDNLVASITTGNTQKLDVVTSVHQVVDSVDS